MRGIMADLTSRFAVIEDLPVLRALMSRAIAELQSDFLDPAQIAASHKVMGLDTQLVHDRTYLLVEAGDEIVGCGGWSFRATLYGGDDSIVDREPALLDPSQDAAKIRAMYTHPAHARRGIGTMVIDLCEAAARAQGFRRAELMATAAGVPLYRKLGYQPVEELRHVMVGTVAVPLLRMSKRL